MAERRLHVDCPACGGEVVTNASVDLVGDDRLTGRETTCDDCGRPVGVYWY